MIIAALTGMALGAAGKLTVDDQTILSEIVESSENERGILEINLSEQEGARDEESGLIRFFSQIIPSNIFQALSMGSIAAIVFFSVVLGAAIAYLKEESSMLLTNVLSAVFEAFRKLLNGSLYLLPFALICLIAGQIAAINPQTFFAMLRFIKLFGIGSGIIFLIAAMILTIQWLRSGIGNPLSVLPALCEPILLSLASRNTMAVLPAAFTCLDEKLKRNPAEAGLVLPLGMTLGRFGNIFYFALAAFFAAELYGAKFGIMQYGILFLAAILGGTATTGTSGLASLSMLGIVLTPLKLPPEAVLVIFIAIDPLIDPFRTLLNVYVNMAACALITKKDDKEDELKIARKQARKKQFLVYVQANEKPPILSRKKGTLSGFEISVLEEIGRRLGKEVVFMDSVSMRYEEEVKAKREADIIAGVIQKSQEVPAGYKATRTWATITEKTKKTNICFLVPAERADTENIDEIIKNLVAENYLKN
jgi:proton glutamate symport protein